MLIEIKRRRKVAKGKLINQTKKSQKKYFPSKNFLWNLPIEYLKLLIIKKKLNLNKIANLNKNN